MTLEIDMDALADAIAARLAHTPTVVPLVPRLLSAAQAALYTGRSLRAFRALAADGAFPTVRHDTRCFFDIHDLDNWIQHSKH